MKTNLSPASPPLRQGNNPHTIPSTPIPPGAGDVVYPTPKK